MGIEGGIIAVNTEEMTEEVEMAATEETTEEMTEETIEEKAATEPERIEGTTEDHQQTWRHPIE